MSHPIDWRFRRYAAIVGTRLSVFLLAATFVAMAQMAPPVTSGDQVILSDMSNYDNYDRVELK